MERLHFDGLSVDGNKCCAAATELGPLPGDSSFWRFNRTQDYGYKGKNEDAEALAKQFALKDLQ